MLGDHVAGSRVVAVLAHVDHLEGVHDAVEEHVIQLDAVSVSHPLKPFQSDGHSDERSIVWMLRLEHGFLF